MHCLCVAADCSDDYRAAQLRQLDGVMANGAGASRNEHDRAPLKLRQTNCLQRGHRRNAQTGALRVVNLIGQMNGLDARQGDVIRRGPVCPLPLPVPDPDPLSDAVGHVDADGVDHAGAITVGNNQRCRQTSAESAPADFPIRGVDAGRAQFDSYFTRSRLRRWLLTDLQHISRRALPTIERCAHCVPSAADLNSHQV